jgi:hypothetical protein
MSLFRVYGFTDDAGRLALNAEQLTMGGQPVTIVSNGLLHALIGPEPAVWPWMDNAQHTLQRLMVYHRVLGEAGQRLVKIVPASFESVFESANSVHHALAQHQRDILDLLARYGDKRQFSLTVRWDMTAMQHLVKRYGYKDDMLANERKVLRDQTLLAMQNCLQDIIILESADNEMVLHALLLARRTDEEKLMKALQRLDQECHNRLALRVIGPMPTSNFARVELKLPEVAVVKEACRTLGIGNVAKLSDVKTAYRHRVKALHPDRNTNSDQHDVMVRLTQSYRYLTRLAAQQNTGAETNPDQQWLRCDNKTLRQTPLMRIQRGMTRWDDALMKRA